MSDTSPLLDPALMAFVNEFEREAESQSDRAIAVLGLAGIDYFLELLLKSHMIGASPEVFSGTAPLATASARMAIARGFGLISADEFADLQLLRRVRNVMAHRISGASFEDASIRDRCLALTLCDRLFTPRQVPFAELPTGTRGMTFDESRMPVIHADALRMTDPTSPRIRFVTTVSILMRVLPARSRVRQPSEPVEFRDPTEPVSLQMDRIDELVTAQEELKVRAESLLLRSEGAERAEAEEILAEIEKSTATLMMISLMGRYSNAVLKRSREIAGLHSAPE